MSESNDISNNSGLGSAAEPSMEEILASIRRILKEDEGTFDVEDDADDEVLVLDASMIAAPADISTATELPAEDGLITAHEAAPRAAAHEPVHFSSGPAMDMAAPEPACPWLEEEFEDGPVAPEPERAAVALVLEKEKNMDDQVHPPESLVSEATRNDIANSVGALVHSISHERSVSVSRGGITIEDIVREEIKPVLRAWLDTHLPPLVERIVRAEIERVIDRTQA
jgi:cell pole-organizing protein PopZ